MAESADVRPFLSKVADQKNSSSLAINQRIREITACRMEGMATDERLSRILQVSPETAKELASGHKAYTVDMIQFIADRYGVSVGWLASGVGSPGATIPDQSDEVSFVDEYRKCDSTGQACIEFILGMLNPCGFLELLSEDDRASVAASIERLLTDDKSLAERMPELQLNVLPKVRERYALDRETLDKAELVITPLHELKGITGPYRKISLTL